MTPSSHSDTINLPPPQPSSLVAPLQLLSALQALYHGDPAVKDQANKWLEAFQQSAEAWQVSNDILHAPGAGMEAHYFAAQTLRTKVQRDFEELPAGAAGALRDSLVALLVQHCSGSAAVRTQLCLAVAALAAHLPAVQWGPSGVVGWLAQRLGGEPQTVSLPCMLELLTVLPQVRWGRYCRVGEVGSHSGQHLRC